MFKYLLIVAALLVLSACGGGDPEEEEVDVSATKCVVGQLAPGCTDKPR